MNLREILTLVIVFLAGVCVGMDMIVLADAHALVAEAGQ